MKKKDLAKEYLNRKVRQAPFKSHTINSEFAFSANDIEAAFNAGRESVIENISELEWKECICNNDEYFASCPVGRYKVSRWHDLFEVWCNAYFICYRLSLSEAKQAANEDYKNRIKQALGL